VQLKTGSRYRSQACDTEVIAVRVPDAEVALTCAGQPVLSAQDPAGERLPADPNHLAGSLLGKRYVGPAGLELLVVKSGAGSLAVDGELLDTKEAKPLPASD
jgi:hypothetical protein